MIINYLKIASRHLVQNKLFSTINIIGLSLGLTVSLLIGLFVSHEWSYDRFHPDVDKIYRIYNKMHFGNFEFTSDKASPKIGPSLKNRLSGVLNYTRIYRNNNALFEISPKKRFTADGFAITEASFFQLFKFPLIKGDIKTVFQNPHSLIIAERVAHLYFGNEEPIGQILYYKGKLPFTITGIMADPPSNSTIQLDMLAPLSAFPSIDRLRNSLVKTESDKTELDNQTYCRGNFETYVLVKDAYTANQIPSLLQKMTIETRENGTQTNLFSFYVQPMTDIHFGVNFGDTSNVRLVNAFGLSAGLVLILALANYISLTTARSTRRAREIAVRKVAGANRLTLAIQFYTESALVTFLSILLASVLFILFRHYFENAIQVKIDNGFITQPLFLKTVILIITFNIIVSGSYPALLLSSYSPAETLRGRLGVSFQSVNIRKVLTVFQFGAAVGLMSCSLIINQQLQLLKTKDIGIKKSQVLAIPFSQVMASKVYSFQQQIKQIPGILDITSADLKLFKNNPITTSFASPVNGQEVSVGIINADESFLRFFEIPWAIEPRMDSHLGASGTMVINESTAKIAGIYDAGLQWPIFGQPINVLGVTKDFNYASLRDKVEPIMMFVKRDSIASLYQMAGGCFYLRFSPEINWQNTTKQINDLYHRYDPESAFTYYFLDEAFNDFHKSETRLASLFNVFTGIGFVIACLGLFGLATFASEQRTKEIGIRKVLGASIISIVALLAKDFLKLIVLGIVISIPISWGLMQSWLQNFIYKIDITIFNFIIASIFSICFALLTISFQTLKAAFLNPIYTLKSE